MRSAPTPPEKALWNALRAGRLDGAKFRRQVVIGRYIADFACRTPTKIVVEADGESHAAQHDYDAERTAFLERKGYRVLRFTNSEISNNLEGVLEAIRQELPEADAPSP
ncbi:endonuclease domain-containing protein [Parasphingopyxis algicola]|nr:endonuclease domain-containing protein [Parasphingopyxis algicola]